MVSPAEAPEVAAPEIVVEAETEEVAAEVDPWAVFDGLSAGTPVGVSETPEAVASERPAVEEAAAATEAPVEQLVPAVIDPAVMQQELAELRQQVANSQAALAQRENAAREQNERGQLETSMVQRQNELEEREGLTPELAKSIAEREISAAWRAYQAERTSEARIAEAEARVQVAVILAEQHKVPLTELLRHATLPGMQSAAQQLQERGSQAAKIAQLEAQVARLTKGGVPAQTFSAGVTDSSGVRVTPQNIDALYAQNPSKYEATYRKFLSQG